jgi:L,D-transpeptidase-like protein
MKKTLIAVGLSIVALPLLWANWPGSSLPPNVVADRLVVKKAERCLLLFSHGQLVKSYPVSLGRNPVGKKEREGDGRTPEGTYVIDFKKLRSSCCYRSLHIFVSKRE